MKPYKQRYILPNGEHITSVVIDESEFNTFCDELRNIMMFNAAGRASDQQIAAIKAAKHLPMMSRGTKTEIFYQRWDIETKLMCVIQRGAGPEVLEQFLQNSPRPQN